MNRTQLRISVRSLVEFLLRHGDIDNRKTAPVDDAMQAGSRIHRHIQSGMGTEYTAEVPLCYEFDTELNHVSVEGRADGIIILPDKVIIDEIKGTYRHLDKINEPELLHLAQARCYAAIFLLQNNLEHISVRITYANLESEEIKYIQSEYSDKEITEWFEGLLAEYSKWADTRQRWHIERQKSIQTLEFPYEYRNGQRDLVGHVYRTIYHGKKLFIEAPTGTGKTLSTLFPAVRSMGEGRGDKIFYLTARTIARTVAEEAMNILAKAGLKARNITLTAKEKICFTGETECNPEACPYAKGHFDRINECLFEMITNEARLSRDVIEEYAKRYEVCPFELSLDASLLADCIICDYNYVFDPRAYLRRFFAETKGDYLFLIDEAHNLVDRGREMYSATLVKEDMLAVRRACKKYNPRIAAAIDKCNGDMLALKRMGEGKCQIVSEPEISKLVGHVDKLHQIISEYLADNLDGPAHDEILDLYFVTDDFLNIYDLMSGNYIIYTDYLSDGDFFIKLFNVDPAKNLANCMSRARSNILFSATLLPIKYYKSLLGGTEEDYEVYAQSVFESSQRLLLQATDVSSRYTNRTHSQYVKMAEYIHRISSHKSGNYIVFAPSYNFMYDVYSAYIEEFYDEEREEVICQAGQMKEEAREEFLRRFRGFSEKEDENSLADLIDADIEIEDKTLIGFCVLGGIFSEGIDLKDDALIGVIVIGTGLPQIGGERDLLRFYFDKMQKNGFDYAYRYPGMNRVQQAAGRLIRTENDRGVIALLDERYSEPANVKLYPREWNDMVYTDITQVDSQVENFWKHGV